ncbi:MAG: hypothetical protein DCC57_08140, partial [Chloroflexi bacterium]
FLLRFPARLRRANLSSATLTHADLQHAHFARA